MKDEKVRKYLKELNRRVMEGLTEQLKPWMPLAVKAQRKLENHIDGIERLSGTDLAVIREILDRACGKPKETVELDTGVKINRIIAELARTRPSRYGAERRTGREVAVRSESVFAGVVDADVET